MEKHLVASGSGDKEHLVDYTIVIEKGPTSYGAHVLELPGCVAAAETREEVSTLIHEAIQLYIEELEKDGLPVPGRPSPGLVGAWDRQSGHR